MPEHGQHGHHDHDGAHASAEHGFTSDRDNEWGSSKIIPANGVVVAGNPPVVQTTGTPSPLAVGQLYRLVNLRGDLKGSQMVSVAAFTRPPGPDPASGIVFAPGPIVGVLEFSGGGGGGTIEFDVPCNGAGGTTTGDRPGVTPGGGAIVSVPGQVIQFSVRNDANLSPNAGQAHAQQIGEPAILPQVSAFAGYGSKTGRLTRSVWAASFDLTGGVAGGDPQILVDVPPFARSFRVLRNQSVAADIINVSLVGPSLVLETFPLPGTILSPEFLTGPAQQIALNFPGANAGVIHSCVLVFNIENGGES